VGAGELAESSGGKRAVFSEDGEEPVFEADTNRLIVRFPSLVGRYPGGGLWLLPADRRSSGRPGAGVHTRRPASKGYRRHMDNRAPRIRGEG